MRVIAFLKDDATFKNLLPYLNESVEIIFVDENNKITDKNSQPLPYQNIVECLFASKWDYILTQGNFIVKQLTNLGIDPARIIDVDFILNDDYVKKVFLAVGLRNKISNFESVIVGDFAAAMGLNANKLLLRTANLASRYQDLKISYLWLKAALTAPKSKIKYAIIGLSPYSLRYDLSLTADKWQALSYYSIFKGQMNFPLTDDAMSALFDENFLNVYELSTVNYSTHANQYAGLNFADPLGEKQLNNYPLAQESVFSVRSDARRWDADKYFHAAQSNTEIFLDCLKLCHDHNVTPIVVKLPVHAFYKSLFPAELTAELDAMIYRAKKIVPFRLIDAFSWNLQDGGEFCRMDALNSTGAKRVTAKVNALIEKLHAKKIRVAFICQGGHLEKLSPVYEVMRKRDDVIIYILIVPPREYYNEGQPFDPNDERYIKSQERAFENYGKKENVILKKVLSEEGFLDIEGLNLDYVFYKRPYEQLLPPNIKCQTVSKFAKTCYVPYSTSNIAITPVWMLGLKFDFFNNINFCFNDLENDAKIYGDFCKTDTENSDQHFLFLGSPEMEEFGKMFADEVKDNLNKKRKSVLWAPRWEVESGSNFPEYKDKFLTLRDKYKNLKISVRPHPLLFPMMIQRNVITEEEARLYRVNLKEKNIYLDENKTFNTVTLKETLAQSDIMIADLSSIIPLYFLTGNPIIYCDSGYNFFGDSKLIESAIYKANSWDDVEKYLSMLLNGEDPLKDERRRLIKQLNQIHIGAAEKISQCIIDDYYKNKI